MYSLPTSGASPVCRPIRTLSLAPSPQACVGCAREHAEERIALGAQLMPAVAVEGRSENGVMRVLRLDVALAQLLHQTRGVLDVGEQKGEGSARQAHGEVLESNGLSRSRKADSVCSR